MVEDVSRGASLVLQDEYLADNVSRGPSFTLETDAAYSIAMEVISKGEVNDGSTSKLE